ncbi:MAG: small subunit ribosomal protein S4e [Thermoproteota archaeon]|nr:small subunit ribosomal protein S4e [Thermoproteota archaeon]
MGKIGGSKSLKRMPAPDDWPISKKGFKWVVKSKAGPHSLEQSLPLLIILRDVLHLAKTRKEAQLILFEKNVKIDGKVKTDDDYPVGLMDVIEIPGINETYRLLPIHNRGLSLHAITGDEKEFKLCKIMNKTTVNGGDLQLNLHDGRNILMKTTDTIHNGEKIYATLDLLKVKLPTSEILGHLKFDEGVLVLVTAGKNTGRLGKVVKITKESGSTQRTITLEDDEANKFETISDYVFPVGKGEPWISIPKDD